MPEVPVGDRAASVFLPQTASGREVWGGVASHALTEEDGGNKYTAFGFQFGGSPR
jgi:hypothetical protein